MKEDLEFLGMRELKDKKEPNPSWDEPHGHVDFFNKDRINELLEHAYGLYRCEGQIRSIHLELDYTPHQPTSPGWVTTPPRWDRFARLVLLTNRVNRTVTFMARYCICGSLKLLTVYNEVTGQRLRFGSSSKHAKCAPQRCSICQKGFPEGWEYSRLTTERRAASFCIKPKHTEDFEMCYGCDRVFCYGCMKYPASGYCNDCITKHNLHDWIRKLEASGILEQNRRIGSIVGMTLEDIREGVVQPMDMRWFGKE